MTTVRVGEIDLHLMGPVGGAVEWVGQSELIEQILACWTLVTRDDLPLCPRLVGKPGMGKTTLARAAGQRYGRPVYIYQCTMDTRPEDLLVTPVLGSDARIRYQASSLVSAMVAGGVIILDEANRMSEKSWASLAPLLDNRRYVESAVAGVRIPAHADFRACITMNDDASTYEVPEYMLSRIQPLIALEFPEYQEELDILRYNVEFAPEDLLKLCARFLATSHSFRLNYSTRDGINILRFAVRLERQFGIDLETAFHRAVEQVLGEGAEDFEARARAALIDDGSIRYQDLFGPADGDSPQEDGDEGPSAPPPPPPPRRRPPHGES